MSLLAAAGGDTVKLFDVSVETGDPCTMNYTPSPGCSVNSVKWNHTNLVVVSAGDDKKISLWRKNGQSLGTIPVTGTDGGDNIEESILAISFSNKASKYICSGGTGYVVRIWDLQKRRCIKWLRGHTNAVTGVMYNCRDEHLASISVSGDLILHSLVSGSRVAELKDPHEQVLRVIDYSGTSRHLVATAGDDGSLHLWDTTGRSPKVSWLKQHSAPVAGIGFSPSNDKIMTSVGLDKKLYTYDSGSRKPSAYIAYEAPFSSMAFRDDGWALAAGTSNGCVVFYDVRAKPQPVTILRAYGSTEAVSSLCWQRSKAVTVSESSCTTEMAILGGGALDDSILMPDPLPSLTSSTVSSSSSSSNPLPLARSSPLEVSSLVAVANGSAIDETPRRTHLQPAGMLTRLHAPRSSYNFKDDMDVFSPLVDVRPIIPSLDKLWDEHAAFSKGDLPADKKFSSFVFPPPSLPDDAIHALPVFDWKSSLASRQDDNPIGLEGATPMLPPPSKGEDATTPPEACDGERLIDKLALAHLPQPLNVSSQLGASTSANVASALTFSGPPPDPPYCPLENSMGKDLRSNQPRPIYSLLPRRYTEQIGHASASDVSSPMTSPKTKKTGSEIKGQILNSLFKPQASAAKEPAILPPAEGGTASAEPKGNSFTIQLFQQSLEESLDSFRKSIHEDMRNLHIEILRQFHIQEMELSRAVRSIHKNQAQLMEEIKSLRKETHNMLQFL